MSAKLLMEQIRQLGQLHLEGNIVPPSWYQHLKYPSGKPYHIAITLLSEIVYWFRPRMVRDEHTGELLGWEKKFKGDGIQRSYAAWGAPFGFTKREAADAIKYLVSETYITTDIRDITLPDGTLRPNVVVITGVDPIRLRLITYSRRNGHSNGGGNTAERTTKEEYSVSTDEVVPRNVIPVSGYDVSMLEVAPSLATPSLPHPIDGGTPQRDCLENNLKIILENNLENSLGTVSNNIPVSKITTRVGFLSLEDEETKLPERLQSDNHGTAGPSIQANEEQAHIAKHLQVEQKAALVTTVTNQAAAEAIRLPAILIHPKSRKAILELGQRPGREDLAFPNVAAAVLWVSKTWNILLVEDVPEVQVSLLSTTLSNLEMTLSGIRESALREKKCTFTHILDSYLREDDELPVELCKLPTIARLSVFATTMLEIAAQLHDTPSVADQQAIQSFLRHDAA